MKNNFAVLIPSYGRPDRVYTIETLRKSGYTGRIVIVCDDSDKAIDEYKSLNSDEVFVFSKSDYAGKFDKMDNFGNMSCVVFARNAMWDIAKALGLVSFVVADDDYVAFERRITGTGGYFAKRHAHSPDLDAVFSAYNDFLLETSVATVCLAQGGDYIGGAENSKVADGFKVSRKMMNLYFFHADRPIEFKGTINEDLTSSVTHGVTGGIILTSMMNSIVQKETQTNAGGLTELYLSVGTYVKSFYSVIAAPSCIKVSTMGDTSLRLHHQVTWRDAVPKIIRAHKPKEATNGQT